MQSLQMILLPIIFSVEFIYPYKTTMQSREYEFWSYHPDLKWKHHFSAGTCCIATGSGDFFSSSGVLYYVFMASLL